MGFEFRGTGAPAHIAAVSAFLIVFLVHLTGQVFIARSFITEASQVLLMPALAAILFSATACPRMRIVKLGFVALFFSWLGDTLPRFMNDDAGFFAMVAGFLVAQCVYIAAFSPYRRRSIASKPLYVAPYIAVAIILLALCFDNAGVLFIPIAAYATVIVIMAILATGLGPTGLIGGVIFLVSDSLIALGAFTDFSLPGQGFWVMLTYVIGQTLLIQAIIGQEERNTLSREMLNHDWRPSYRRAQQPQETEGPVAGRTLQERIPPA